MSNFHVVSLPYWRVCMVCRQWRYRWSFLIVYPAQLKSCY